MAKKKKPIVVLAFSVPNRPQDQSLLRRAQGYANRNHIPFSKFVRLCVSEKMNRVEASEKRRKGGV